MEHEEPSTENKKIDAEHAEPIDWVASIQSVLKQQRADSTIHSDQKSTGERSFSDNDGDDLFCDDSEPESYQI